MIPSRLSAFAINIVMVVPILGLFILSLIWPVVTIVLRSLDERGRVNLTSDIYFGNFTSIVQDDLLVQISLHTAYLAGASTLVVVLIAFPAAYLISRMARHLSSLMMVLVLMPFWVSIIVRLFAFTIVLGREGPVNDLFELFGLGPYSLLFNSNAVIIGMVAYLLPYMMLILIAAMSSIDQSHLTAAKTMGANERQVFTDIFFPQVWPALMSGSVLIFVLGLGFFLTPALLGGPTDLNIPNFIQQQIDVFRWGKAAAMGILLLVVSVLGYIIALQVGGMQILTPAQPQGSRGHAAQEPLRLTLSTFGCGIALALALLILLFPLIVVIPSSFGETFQIRFPPIGFTLSWYNEVLTKPIWTDSFLKSIRVAAATAIVSTLLGLSLARLGLKVRKQWMRSAIQGIAIAPIIVPVILLAIGIYDVQVRLGMSGTDAGLVVAHAVICVPLVFLILANALVKTDPSLEQAAWTMGVGKIRTFWTIVVPSIWPAMFGAVMISFVTSWDEPVIALFQSGVSKTLPVTIFSFMRSGVTPAVSAMAVLTMTPVLIAAAYIYIRQLRQTSN